MTNVYFNLNQMQHPCRRTMVGWTGTPSENREKIEPRACGLTHDHHGTISYAQPNHTPTQPWRESAARVAKYVAMIFAVLVMSIGQMWGETDYILGLFNVSDGNVALTKNSFGTNGALVYNGSSLATTTAVSFKTSGGDAVTKGSIYYTTNTLTQANCTTATNAGTSSSDGYVRGFQIAVNSTYTLALGDVTATDIYIIGRFSKKQDASNVITIENSSSETIGNISNNSSTGTNLTPNHFSGTFTGNITIQNTSTNSNDEYRALIYIIASDGGGGGGGCSATADAGAGKSTTVGVGVAMAATAASSGYTGAWSIKAGSPSTATSQLGTTSSNTMTFTPNTYGTYTLVWTVTSTEDGTCKATDEATVTVPAPTHEISYTNTKGAANSNPATYTEGVGVASFANLRHAEGYDFTGWSPSSISSSATTNQTIEAQWTARAVAEGSASLTYALTFGSGTITTSSITRVNGALYDATDVSLAHTSFADNTNKTGCSGKLTTTTAKGGYVEVTFKIAEGYSFTPTEVRVQGIAVSTSKTVEVELTDNATTPNSKSVSGTLTAVKSPDTGGYTVTLDFDESDPVVLEGTVTAKIYAYGANDHWRMGTPFVITGTVEEVAGPTMGSYYYRGSANDWGATQMYLSTGELYEYLEATSSTNTFKIAASSTGWDYNADYLKSGYCMTDLTIASDGTGDNNCNITSAPATYYIIVFKPNTRLNRTSDPVICASTTLPDDSSAGLAATKTIYLKPGTNWIGSDAKFAINYNGHGVTANNEWSPFMTLAPCEPDVYKVDIPALYSNIIICRINSAAESLTTGDWSQRWNQTANLVIPQGSDYFTVANDAWDGSTTTWSTYSAPTFSVTYYGNGSTGGSVPTDGNSYTCGDDATVLGVGTLVKAGYSFNGWNTEADGRGTSYTAAATISDLSANVTLYAQWTQEVPSTATVSGTWRLFPGQDISLETETTGGTSGFTYQWQKEISSVWTDIEDATSSTYTKAGCTTEDCGNYRCVVSKAGGTVNSDAFGVKIYTLNGAYDNGEFSSNDITVTSGTTGVATVHLAAGRVYKFKVTDNSGTWFGNSGRILEPVSSWAFASDNSESCILFTGPEGDYTFTVDIDHVTYGTPEVVVSVAYPEVTHPAEGYAYFMNRDNWAHVGLYMWYEGGDSYTTWDAVPWITRTTTICNNTYYYTPLIPSWYNRVIFRDVEGDGKTGDITISNLATYSGKYNDLNDATFHEFSTYTITFAGNENTGGTMAEINGICPNSNQVLPANAFEKTDKAFQGWIANVAVKVGGETVTAGTLIDDEATIQDIASDITLTAQWCDPLNAPSGLQCSNQTRNSARLSWDGSGTSEDYEIKLESASGAGTFNWTAFTANIYDATGLTRNTAYTFRVRRHQATGYCAEYSAVISVDFVTTAAYGITNANPANGTITVDAEALEEATVSISAEADPGYQFSAWAIYKTGDEKTTVSPAAATAITSFTMPDYDVTVSATFVEQTYSVTYAGNGNTGGTVPTDAMGYTSGSPVTVEAGVPTKTGSTFVGWLNSVDNTIYLAGQSFTITAATTLTAVWGGTNDSWGLWWFYNEDNRTTSGFGANNISLLSQGSSNSFTPTSYQGITASYRTGNSTPSASVTIPSGSTATLYFIGKGGSSRTIQLKQGEVVKYSVEPGSSEGSTCSISNIAAGTYTLTSSGNIGWAAVAFRFHTKAGYDVTFDKGGQDDAMGMPADIVGVPSGKKIATPLETPTVDGYSFDGWVTTSGGSTLFDFANSTITGNTTIYAKWVEKALTGISVSDLGLYVGGTGTPAVTKTPTDGLVKSQSWAVKDASTNVITINSTTGEVTAVAPGTKTVVATFVTKDDEEITGEATVTVDWAELSTITISPAEVTIAEGGSQTLTAVFNAGVNPSTAVTWSSSDTDVATVSSTGEVTARKEGTATITCSATAIPSIKGTRSVTVSNSQDPQGYVWKTDQTACYPGFDQSSERKIVNEDTDIAITGSNFVQKLGGSLNTDKKGTNNFIITPKKSGVVIKSIYFYGKIENTDGEALITTDGTNWNEYSSGTTSEQIYKWENIYATAFGMKNPGESDADVNGIWIRNMYIELSYPFEEAVYEDGEWRYGREPDESRDVQLTDNITISSVIKAKSIEIADTKKITITSAGALVVSGAVTREDGTAPTASDLVLESTSDGNATLIFDNSNSAAATVQMYSKATAEGGWTWQYIAAPAAVSALDNYYGGYLYKWVESSWAAVGRDATMELFAGYCVSYPTAGHTFAIEGTLAPTTSKSITVPEGKSMVVGNSWTAPIQITQLEEEDFSGLLKNVYLYNTGNDEGHSASTTSEPTGDAIYAAGTYISVPIHTAEYTGVKVISSLQGFFVKDDHNEEGGGTLKLSYSKHVRPSGGNSVVNGAMHAPKRVADETDRPAVLKMKVSGSQYDDRLILLEREDFTTGYDAGWDGDKMGDVATSPRITTTREDGTADAVAALPDLEGTLINFRAASTDDQYTLYFDYETEDAEPLYLLDLTNNAYTRVETGSSYTFFTTDKADHKRFALTRYRAPQITTGVEDALEDNGQGKAVKFIENDKLYILRNGVLYDGTGKKVIEN